MSNKFKDMNIVINRRDSSDVNLMMNRGKTILTRVTRFVVSGASFLSNAPSQS